MDTKDKRTNVLGTNIPLTLRLWVASFFIVKEIGVEVDTSSTLSFSGIEPPNSDCMLIISKLSLHSELVKSLNAQSSKFFDTSNKRWIAFCSVSASKSDNRACLGARVTAGGIDE